MDRWPEALANFQTQLFWFTRQVFEKTLFQKVLHLPRILWLGGLLETQFWFALVDPWKPRAPLTYPNNFRENPFLKSIAVAKYFMIGRFAGNPILIYPCRSLKSKGFEQIHLDLPWNFRGNPVFKSIAYANYFWIGRFAGLEICWEICWKNLAGEILLGNLLGNLLGKSAEKICWGTCLGNLFVKGVSLFESNFCRKSPWISPGFRRP